MLINLSEREFTSPQPKRSKPEAYVYSYPSLVHSVGYYMSYIQSEFLVTG